MASVRKRSGAWYARYYDERHIHVEIKTRAATKTEAAKLADDLERRAERVRLGMESKVRPMTFDELWEVYGPVARQKRSWDALRSRFEKHLLPAFGTKLIHTIRGADVESFMAKKAAEGYEPQTCNHLRTHLSSIFGFAIKKLKVMHGENPGTVAAKMVIPETAPRFFDPEVVAKIIANVAPQHRALFATAVYTGMRRGELVGLRVYNVDLERQLIVVSKSYGGTTKAARVRHVPIPDELLPILRQQVEAVDGDLLFPNRRGGMLTKNVRLASVLKTALRRAGVTIGFDHVCRTRGTKSGCGAEPERLANSERTPCPGCGRLREAVGVTPEAGFKDLRSTYATHLTEQSGDIRAAQVILGHSSPRITERYAHVRMGHLLAKANMVSFQPAQPLPNKETETNQQNTTEHNVSQRTTDKNNKETQDKPEQTSVSLCEPTKESL